MSKKSNKMLKKMRKQAKPMLMDYVLSGAHRLGKHLIETVGDVTQPSELNLRRLVGVVKQGVVDVGKEAAMEGLERYKNKHSSSNSATTPLE